MPINTANAATIKSLFAQAAGGASGVGVDTELISAVPTSTTFRERNFTAGEIAYCAAAPDP
ncbi:hypothetical protein N4307_14795, partial [Staphylococcus aureus]|nr:hypothetical protein [Staphylococcus aureus]